MVISAEKIAKEFLEEKMSELITILGQEIAKGESVTVEMDIAKLHTRTRIVVPIIVERSLNDGPCLLLTGGIHGDEVNGIEIIRQIIAKGLNKPENGTVICIPVLNVFGFTAVISTSIKKSCIFSAAFFADI